MGSAVVASPAATAGCSRRHQRCAVAGHAVGRDQLARGFGAHHAAGLDLQQARHLAALDRRDAEQASAIAHLDAEEGRNQAVAGPVGVGNAVRPA